MPRCLRFANFEERAASGTDRGDRNRALPGVSVNKNVRGARTLGALTHEACCPVLYLAALVEMFKPLPSRSTSSCTRKDSINGFTVFKACMADRRNCKDDVAVPSSLRVLRYCTKTRAATYRQKAINGFI